jgi:hypothetical protein
MAQRGKASVAHVYDDRDACIYCGMYRVNVEAINHVCKPGRELEVDQAAAEEAGISVIEYRVGDQHGE